MICDDCSRKSDKRELCPRCYAKGRTYEERISDLETQKSVIESKIDKLKRRIKRKAEKEAIKESANESKNVEIEQTKQDKCSLEAQPISESQATNWWDGMTDMADSESEESEDNEFYRLALRG
jgi:hypothetical protein